MDNNGKFEQELSKLNILIKFFKSDEVINLWLERNFTSAPQIYLSLIQLLHELIILISSLRSNTDFYQHINTQRSNYPLLADAMNISEETFINPNLINEIKNLYNNGATLEQIARITLLSQDIIRKYI